MADSYIQYLQKLPVAYSKLEFNRTVESSSMGCIIPVLASTFNVKTAIEIGVAYGWTANCLCAGLEASAEGDGVLISADINKEWLDKVEVDIKNMEFDVKHVCIDGNSLEFDWGQILKDNNIDSIDMAMIDGDHLGVAPLTDLENVIPHMSETGIILMHDYGDYYNDVVVAVNTVLKTGEWRIFQLPQNRRTNETGCCILQRDKFHSAAPGVNGLPQHITDYHDNIITKTLPENKLSQSNINNE